MGWLSRFAGITEHLKLEVLMNFDTRSGQGVSALRWIVMRPHASLSAEQSRIALVALLYARTLINHQETRAELFDRMAQSARRVLEGDGKLTFEPWTLYTGRQYFSIWPWTMTEPERVIGAKIYTAKLVSSHGGTVAINLNMALGLERILAPSSALIAAYGLAAALNDSDRARLAAVLLAINAYYHSPSNLGVGSEPGALKAAMPVLLRPSGDVKIQPEGTGTGVGLRDSLLRLSREAEVRNKEFTQSAQAAGSTIEYQPSLETEADHISFGIFVVVNELHHKFLDRIPGPSWMIPEMADDLSVSLCGALAMYFSAVLHHAVLADDPQMPALLAKSIAGLFFGAKTIYTEDKLRKLFERATQLKNDFVSTDHPKAVELREGMETLVIGYTVNKVSKRLPEEDMQKALFGIYDSLRGAIETKN